MGEGAVPHCVATAEFLITWQEDGTPKVVEWWIEEDKSVWANTHESRICYMDGYYYYASQSDHYFLYRVKEDGSSPQCLAKLHASDICAQDGVVYFVNLSDENGIYRINADGTGLKSCVHMVMTCSLARNMCIFVTNIIWNTIHQIRNWLFRLFRRKMIKTACTA